MIDTSLNIHRFLNTFAHSVTGESKKFRGNWSPPNIAVSTILLLFILAVKSWFIEGVCFGSR